MQYSSLMRKLRICLVGKTKVHIGAETFHHHSQTYEKTLFAIRFFYLCLFLFSASVLFNEADELLLRPMGSPQWPLQLFGWPAQKKLLIPVFEWTFLLSSAICVFSPTSRIFRILSFVALLYIVAFYNSDGHHSHFMHLMMYPAFFMIFLPKTKIQPTRRQKHSTILGFWGGQLGICIAYQMAGYSKITEIFRCLYGQGFEGCQVGTYIMTSMAAKEYIQYQWPVFTGDLLYQFPLVGAVMYYGVIWIHNISIIFPFRFHLHRFFLCYRILFHFGTLILFGISFSASILAVVSMFAFSPFYRPSNFKTILKSLPPVGWFVR